MRSWIFTPVFAKAAMLEEFLQHVYSQPDNTKGFKHVILGNYYPVNEKYNQWKIENLARDYGCIYIDSLYDRGLHDSLNNAMNIVGVKREDTLTGVDCDDRPSHGAFQAMRDVMLAEPEIAVLGLNFWVLPHHQKNSGLVMEEHEIAGHRVWRHPGVEMWNISAFNTGLIQDMGGFKQPNAYYGGIEIALHREWTRKRLKGLYYLRDHTAEAVQVNREDPNLYDKSYGEWKIDHATRGFGGSFAEWLKEKGK